MKRILKVIGNAAAVLVVAAFLALALRPGAGEAEPHGGTVPHGAAERTASVREHILAHGTEETGSFNLVTAIYLGYRAWDTLGETIVLLLSVSGVVYLVGAKR